MEPKTIYNQDHQQISPEIPGGPATPPGQEKAEEGFISELKKDVHQEMLEDKTLVSKAVAAVVESRINAWLLLAIGLALAGVCVYWGSHLFFLSYLGFILGMLAFAAGGVKIYVKTRSKK